MSLPDFPEELGVAIAAEYGYGALVPHLRLWYTELAAVAKERGSPRLEDAFLRASRGERHPEMPRGQSPVDLYVPGLGRKPFFQRGEFSFMTLLERHHATIKAELLALRARPRFTPYATTVGDGDWLAYHFFEAGHRFDAECALCPETTRVIESIPGHAGGLVGFFALAPGGRIDPHFGMHNAKARVSLGVTGCDGAYIQVGGEIRRWTEGVCLALDDSYRHRVWHDGPVTRFVLLMDVWHPNLSAVEIEILDHYYTRSPVRASWLAEMKRETPADPAAWWVDRH